MIPLEIICYQSLSLSRKFTCHVCINALFSNKGSEFGIPVNMSIETYSIVNETISSFDGCTIRNFQPCLLALVLR